MERPNGWKPRPKPFTSPKASLGSRACLLHSSLSILNHLHPVRIERRPRITAIRIVSGHQLQEAVFGQGIDAPDSHGCVMFLFARIVELLLASLQNNKNVDPQQKKHTYMLIRPSPLWL